jgi:excisionase family DNA binding protein
MSGSGIAFISFMHNIELAGENAMTLPAHSKRRCGRFPSLGDRKSANQLRCILAAQNDGEATLNVIEQETEERIEITLTSALSDLLLELLKHIERGSAVTLVPIREKLTTQQAADLLNVSRPTLVKLLEQKVMKHTLVGRHRRIDTEDVLAYKSRQDKKRTAAMGEILSQDSDLL